MVVTERSLPWGGIRPKGRRAKDRLGIQGRISGIRNVVQERLAEREVGRRLADSFEEGQWGYWYRRRGQRRRLQLILRGETLVLDWGLIDAKGYIERLAGILDQLDEASQRGDGKVGVRVRNGRGPAEVVGLDDDARDFILAQVAGFTSCAAKDRRGGLVSVVQRRVSFTDCPFLDSRMETLFSSFFGAS